MIKRWFWLLGLLLGLCWLPQPVQAQSQPQVLLIYDSENVSENKAQRITALQQLLISAGANVHRQALSTYRQGQLQKGHYTAVVTQVNWDDEALTNAAFIKDRKAFGGIKLHVGGRLAPDELQSLDAKAQPLYRRQLAVSWPGIKGRQLLPYTTPVTLLTRTGKQAQNLGSAVIQGGDGRRYPFAAITGKSGYLPYFDGEGFSELAAASVIARLFGRKGSQAPLLAVTGVTPYTKAARLKQLAAYLHQRGLPFVISATSMSKNTEMTAFEHYAATLRLVVRNGGVLFLQTPKPPVMGSSLVGNQILATDVANTIVALAQRHVYPAGMSFPTYWENDHLYRRQALKAADTGIQLPDDRSPIYAQRDDRAQAFKLAFSTVKASSLTTQRYGQELSRSALTSRLPLAVTFAMPENRQQWLTFKRQLNAFSGRWRDPADFNTQMQAGMISLAYQNGRYFVNGRLATGSYRKPKALHLEAAPQNWTTKFFQIQSKVMWGFFIAAFTIMTVLLVLGRRLYLRMYRREARR